MATKKAKAKKEEKPKSAEELFEDQLEELGLGDALKLADEYDNDVEVLTTGFPGLDRAIDDRGINSGLPKRRYSEMYSKKEHAGKTSLSCAIGVTWQLLGMRVGVLSIESDLTLRYMKEMGFITSKEEAELRGLYAVRLLQPQVRPEDFTTDMLYVEAILDIIAKAADVFDLLIVDSVDALVSESEAVKSSSDNEQAGGIAKKMRMWFRKNTSRRAHVMFLNHAGANIGKGGPGGPSYYTSGGKSVPRYSSLRFELTVLEKLKEGDKDPYGFITRVQLVKDRLGPNWRYCDLYYIFGEGFSKEYDYFKSAIRLKILLKSGAWLYLPGEGKNEEERKKNCRWKWQGELNSYRALTGKIADLESEDKELNAKIWTEIKKLIDGEDAEAEVLEESEQKAKSKEEELEEMEVAE